MIKCARCSMTGGLAFQGANRNYQNSARGGQQGYNNSRQGGPRNNANRNKNSIIIASYKVIDRKIAREEFVQINPAMMH